MIAIDTSSMVAFLQGDAGADAEEVDAALEEKQGVFPPVVLAELLSDPRLTEQVRGLLKAIPVLETREGFWERTGLLRAQVLRRGFKARLADALVAQSCIDHRTSLISRDGDFRHFARIGGLHLVK